MEGKEKIDTLEKATAFVNAQIAGCRFNPEKYTAELVKRLGKLTDDNFWRWREFVRYALTGEYQQAGWMSTVKLPADHFTHVSKSDPMMVAFTTSVEDGKRDRQVKMKVGKYLQKQGFEDVAMRKLISAHRSQFVKVEIQWSDSPEDALRVYTEGPNSCMSTAKFEGKGKPPTYLYHSRNVRIAYIQDVNDPDRITARAVCNIEKKTFARSYGDIVLIEKLLKEDGYTKAESLAGAELPLVWANKAEKKIVMPYLDGTVWAFDIDEKAGILTINPKGKQKPPERRTDGVLPLEASVECPECHEHFSTRAMIQTHRNGLVCPSCIATHYALVFDINGRHVQVRKNDPEVVITTNGSQFVDAAAAAHCNYVFVEKKNAWMYRDETVKLADGRIVPKNEAVVLLASPTSGVWMEREQYLRGLQSMRTYSHPGGTFQVWLPQHPGLASTEQSKVEAGLAFTSTILLEIFRSLGQLRLDQEPALLKFLRAARPYHSWASSDAAWIAVQHLFRLTAKRAQERSIAYYDESQYLTGIETAYDEYLSEIIPEERAA